MSNLTRLTLHNNSLTVMDRDLFQVGTVDYITPYIIQLTDKTRKHLIHTKNHTEHCAKLYTVMQSVRYSTRLFNPPKYYSM